MAPFPSLTKNWHAESYPAIDPARPELSTRGKVVAITGGGGAIGGETALAFAKAGATKIAIIGRREKPLQENKSRIEKAVAGANVLAVQGDIANEDSVRKAFGTIRNEFGPIDILVCNAAYLPKFASLDQADAEDWWQGYETNVKGAFNCTRAFLPVAGKDPILVDVSTGVVAMPAMATGSGYQTSKLAATKVYEAFGSENAHVSVAHVHPGIVESEINVKSGVGALDQVNLPASFIVWVCSPEAKFVRGGGKYLWCNWDVEELKGRREELEKPGQLTIVLSGWPFGAGADYFEDSLKF